MTAEEAISYIRDILAENNSIKPSMVVFELEKEALYMAIKALEHEPKWIPCTERLPEERMNCLITVEVTPYACNSSYEVHTAWFDGRNFIDKTYFRVEIKRRVMAWQPLPEAYTESEEEE